MKAGEYIGVDGRTYRWKRNDVLKAHVHSVAMPSGAWCEYAVIADWPAAKAALDALLEAEAGEWVVLEDDLRVSRDGSKAQVLDDCRWLKLVAANMTHIRLLDAYRAGLKVGREAAGELAEAHLYCVEHEGNCGSCPVLMSECIALAKKVQP